MATGDGVNQGKTAFLKEFLPDNPDADQDAVNQAWKAMGNEGTISESLFGKIRSSLGLTGKRDTKGVASRETAGPAPKGKARSSPKGAAGKTASKAVATPSPSEGRDAETGPSKSAFVEEVLGRQPEANLRAVNEAWSEAGSGDSISPSIFYKIKREVGEAGGHTSSALVESQPKSASRVREAGPAAQARPESSREPVPAKPVDGSGLGERERVLDRVEDEIDDLIGDLKQLGGMEKALEALKTVRRVVVRSHEG